MFDVPALAPRVEDAIAALREDGVTLSDADVVWLSRLREACDVPESGRVRGVMGAPLQYAGVMWWPLHRLAEDWWRASYEQLATWSDLRTDAYLMAHVFSAPGDVSLLQWTGDILPHAVIEWRARIAIHEAQILPLLQTLKLMDGYADNVPAPIDDERKAVDPAMRTRGLVALCKAFPGTTPEYWQTRAPVALIDEIQTACASSESWADSEIRTEAIKRWLSAVRWLRNRGRDDGE